MSVKKTIICFDDFERKGDKLQPKEILGLATQLKEQRNCKILLILNEESFTNEDREEFKLYREKVLDKEVYFKPSVEECLYLAFPEEENQVVYEQLRTHSKKLEIRNIRILKRMEILAIEFETLATNYENAVLLQCLHTLVIGCVAHYSSDDSIPNLEFLKNPDIVQDGLAEADERKMRIKWLDFLYDYGYTETDGLDVIVAEGVEAGFINEDRFHAEVLKKNEEQKRGSFKRAWRLFEESFGDNEKELLDTLKNAFEENIQSISSFELHNIVWLFVKLDREPEADELIDMYTEKKEDKRELFDFGRKYPGNYANIDEDVCKNIIAKFDTVETQYSFEHSMSNLLELKRFNKLEDAHPEDLQIAAAAEVEEFVCFFESQEGNKLSEAIWTCLGMSGSGEKEKIKEKATEALKRIGKRSKLNELRLEKYRVSIWE